MVTVVIVDGDHIIVDTTRMPKFDVFYQVNAFMNDKLT